MIKFVKKIKFCLEEYYLALHPVSSKKNIDFLKWLGVEIPLETEKRLLDEKLKMTDESLKIATEILIDILQI